MGRATYETLSDAGTVFGEIPGFDGVWANAATRAECERELQEVLEDWLLLGLKLGHQLPVIEGIDLNAKVPA